LAKTGRNPGQPSVKAVTSVGSIRPTFSGFALSRGDIDLCPGDGAKDRAVTVNRLDVADADFQVAFVVVTAPYKG
jgi:hypothetical protein